MNDENLKPFGTLSESEERAIRSKGGKASGESRRKRKLIRETILDMLATGNVQDDIVAAILQKAKDGDVRAFEVVRDTAGEKPVDKQEITTPDLKWFKNNDSE